MPASERPEILAGHRLPFIINRLQTGLNFWCMDPKIRICKNISHLDTLFSSTRIKEGLWYGLVKFWCVEYGIYGMLVWNDQRMTGGGRLLRMACCCCLWLVRCTNLHSHPDPESFVDIFGFFCWCFSKNQGFQNLQSVQS